MEFLIIIGVIVLVIYFIGKVASSKHLQGQAQDGDAEEDVVVSSGPGASIVLTVEGLGFRSTRTRHKPVDPDSVWIPPGRSVKVAGEKIPSGMLYVGKYLQPAGGYRDIEPSLINPKLKVDWSSPDFCGSGMDYWPSYSGIDPACRAAYLNWLINGKNDSSYDIGYVFIFFYGLERRFFVDTKTSEAARSEMPAITAEVKRLLGIYGSNGSFKGYANSFLDAALLIQPFEKLYKSSPPEDRTGWELPMSVRLGLGQLIIEGKPIPVDWAYSWVMLHPETYLRTPAKRCTKEFKFLFKIRYAAKYGDGMKIKPNKTRLKAKFTAASHGIGAIDIPCGDIPDIGRLSGPVNKLRKIVESCTDSLDPLSRLLGRKPSLANSLEALALLPEELLSATDNPQATKIKEWLRRLLGDNQQAYVNASELVKLWPSFKDDRLTKKESISLAHMLEKFRIGLEPDPRFGGTNLKAEGKAILFRLSKDAPKAASKEYQAATVLLHLAASISGADGTVAESERDYLEAHLEEALDMSSSEKTRLRAHLDWLLHDPPGLAGIKKRIESLKSDEKKAIAAFCVGVAGADGHIDPSEIKILNKLYPMLGFEADDVYTHIHMMMSSAPVPSTGSPVTVQAADTSVRGYKIPSASSIDEMRTKGVDLDMSVVQTKLKETAKVTQILGDIFQEELEEIAPALAEPEAETIGSLDAAHSQLLRALIAQPEWSRADFESLVENIGLLPDGALDIINEAAYEICDEPLVDGEDPILVEMDVAKELFA